MHLTIRRDIGNKFVQILEICEEAFDGLCYDSQFGKITEDTIYYLNYHQITKLYLFQKKRQSKGLPFI